MTKSANSLVKLLNAIDPAFEPMALKGVTDPEVIADVDSLVSALRLQKVRRYFHQVHWLEESQAAERADDAEPGLKLENVAAHSWHVADAVLLLGSRFSNLDVLRSLQLAILHDKLEIYTGDFDPVGADGRGGGTHAFDKDAQRAKSDSEREALDVYVNGLRPSIRNAQRALLEENIQALTREARFVKAIDKVQALVFVHEKKAGALSDEHVAFSLRYSYRAVEAFQDIGSLYVCLIDRFIRRIAAYRQCDVSILVDAIERKLHLERRDTGQTIRLALVGKSGAGKSEVSRRLTETHAFASVKTGAICRAISKLLFGNDAKSSTQRLDDALTTINPSIFLTASLRGASLDQDVVVDSLRFVDDVSLVRELGFKTLRVICDDTLRHSRLIARGQTFDPGVDGLHRSETELDDQPADYEIQNQGSLKDLNAAIDSIVQSLR